MPWLIVWLCLTSTLARGANLPSGFMETAVGSGWESAVGVTFGPNASGSVERVYVWDRFGRVWIVENDVKQTTPLLDIREEVGVWGDYGLLGFALDPAFRENGYVYCLYVVDRHHLLHAGKPTYNANASLSGATIGRLTRYTCRRSDDFRSVDPTSRRVLLGESISTGIPILHTSHGVGSLAFATDGSLMVSTGDAASYTALDVGGNVGNSYGEQALADGIISPAENIGSYRSQLLDSLGGKLLRLDPATGDGMAGNPHFDPAAPRSARSRMWSLGLRNPCRFVQKPGTGSHDAAAGNPGTFYIGDVGWVTYEELVVADGPGQNFGWPLYEGYFRHPAYWTARPAGMEAADHKVPAIEWRHEAGGARALYNGTIHTLGAADSAVAGAGFLGRAACGGAFYTGTSFPPEWHGVYFQADFSLTWVRAFTMDENDQVRQVREFATDEYFVHLAVHPRTGELYYTAVPNGSRPGAVRRISYAPGGNRPPVAVAKVDRQYGPGPLTVQFSSALSADPEKTALSYTWAFGDGTVSTEANPRKTYTGSGMVRFDAVLTVRDAGGAAATDTVIITLNNSPPAVQITSPAAGARYSLSQSADLVLSAAVSDSEHALNDLTHEWQVSLVHDNHEHLEAPIPATSGTVRIDPLGSDADATYYYRILLRVTDPLGLSTVTERRYFPATGTAGIVVNPDFASVPRGGAVLVEVLANDHGAVTDADFSTLQIVSAPASGTAVADPVTGRIRYLHGGGSGVADNFSYRLRTRAGTLSPECLVDILLTSAAANNAPVALSDTASVVRGQSAGLSLLANDVDPGGAVVASSLVIHTLPASGVLTLNGSTGALTYTHHGSAAAADEFTYSVADAAGLRSEPAVVRLTITAPNGAPVLSNPGAQTSLRGAVVSLPLIASDPNGQALTFSATGLPVGLSIQSSTGVISGTVAPTAQSGSVTVTASDGSLSAAVTFAWNIGAAPSGNGLLGEYFAGLTPAANPALLTRIDRTLNFEWRQGSPGGAVPVDQFSARWTGDITARFSETYTFSIPVDNGVRLWIDNVLVLDKWLPAGTTGSYTLAVPLTAGRRTPFKLDYYEEWGSAGLVVNWFSASQPWEVVPSSAFQPAGNAGDTTPPAVSLTTAAAGVSGPFNVSASFSEGVSGLAASDFSVSNGSATALSGSGGTWTLTVNPASGGSVSVSLPAGRCYDAAGNANAASAPVTVTFTAPPNRPPVITGVLPQSSLRGSIISLPMQASDPDGQALTWSASGLPVGLSLDAATGLISGTVSLTAAAEYSVNVTVRDPMGLTGSVVIPWNTAAYSPITAGLRAQYFEGLTPGAGPPLLTRTDTAIDFGWGIAAPAAGLPADQFSVRWSGVLTPAHTARTTFTIAGDNGYRLWIGGVLIIDNWLPVGTGGWRSAAVDLTAGRPTPIRLEYYDEWGGAAISLYWQSAVQTWEVVPATRLSAEPGTGGGAVLDAVRANFTIIRDGSGSAAVTFTRPPASESAALILEASGDFRSWQTVDHPATVTRLPGGGERISIRVFPVPGLTAPRRYFRLRVVEEE